MFIRELLESLVRLPQEFAGVATHDPVSAVLLAIGAFITLLSAGYFGVLVLGALADWLNPTAG